MDVHILRNYMTADQTAVAPGLTPMTACGCHLSRALGVTKCNEGMVALLILVRFGSVY